jgi:16S rRNA (cytosine967-C5)-methyltransferase
VSASGAPARAGAARAGIAVETGTLLPQAIHAALSASNLSPRDRGLATEIAYGTERWRALLDYALRPHLRRPIHTLEPAVRTLLRQGAYQLLKLSLPSYAVVNSAAEATRSLGVERARGLVNAVLRRVSEQGVPAFPADPVQALSVRYAHPLWLVRRWVERLGFDAAETLLAENQETPPLILRVNRRRAELDAILAAMPAAEPVEGLPYALSLRAQGDVRALPGYDEGLFQVQDTGAQAVGEAIGPAERFLELACGRGTKTLQQAERQDGTVLGVDLDGRRIREAQAECGRLQLSARFLQGDARELPMAEYGQDAVLLDAPCSALGVVRRRPDAKWRRQERDLAANGKLQADLLRCALRAIRPGGVVTYSVCSLEPEETIGPVREVQRESGARVLTTPPPLARGEAEVGFFLPGMYVAQLCRD